MSEIESTFTEPQVNPAMRGLLMGGDAYSVSQDWWEDRVLFDTALDMTGMDKPNVLIVPTARAISAEKSDRVVDGLTGYFQKRGAKATALHPYLYVPSDGPNALAGMEVDASRVSIPAMQDKTAEADMVFVMGGDTNRMLKAWASLGIDTMLLDSLQRGAVISGSSAGTMAWFEGGLSDGDSTKAPDKLHTSDFHYVSALGAIAATVVCPHYEAVPNGVSRSEGFEKMMLEQRSLGRLGLGITSKAALQIDNAGELQVIRGTGKGKGRPGITSLHYRNGERSSQVIHSTDGSFTLADLVV